MQENEDIVRQYRERGLLVEADTSTGTEESREKLYNRLQKDTKWMDVMYSKATHLSTVEHGGEAGLAHGRQG